MGVIFGFTLGVVTLLLVEKKTKYWWHSYLVKENRRLKNDRNYWKHRAKEHSSFWKGTSAYYRDRWTQALSELPSDVAARLLGEFWEHDLRDKKWKKDRGK